jgi:hypothetical protein
VITGSGQADRDEELIIAKPYEEEFAGYLASWMQPGRAPEFLVDLAGPPDPYLLGRMEREPAHLCLTRPECETLALSEPNRLHAAQVLPGSSCLYVT